MSPRLLITGAMALSVALTATACGPDDGEPDAGSVVDGGTDAGVYDPGPFTRILESEASAGRESCRFGRGAMPWETVGEEHPIGDDIPIDHFVILMQENRSFDHYFGTMPGVDGIPAGASNPDGAGGSVEPFHTTDYCIDGVGHSWNDSHRQFNGGANDGFVTTNAPGGERAMGYLDDSDLPFYWDLAQTFAFSDHHHCSVLGPTWVNRFYFLSATSFGLVRNSAFDTERIPDDGGDHVIFEQLDRARVSWRVYSEAVPFVFGGYPHYALRPQNRRRSRTYEEFLADLEAGDLPEVLWLDPSWDFVDGVDANDEHAPANPQRGQAFVRDVITRIMASDIWPRTAIVLTYDEHGGFYDHVPPPEACAPGDHPPDLGDRDVADFDRLGFRVPLTVVSPYSRAGHVSDRVTDLTSVLRLLQARYLLPAMTGRDANAWPMLDMFDFENPPFMTPPALAEAPVNMAQVDACRAAFP